MNCSVLIDANHADNLCWEHCPGRSDALRAVLFSLQPLTARSGEGWGERLCGLTCRRDAMFMSVWQWDLKIHYLVGSVKCTPIRYVLALCTALCCKHTPGWIGMAWHSTGVVLYFIMVSVTQCLSVSSDAKLGSKRDQCLITGKVQWR